MAVSSSVGQAVNANIAPAISVEVEIGPGATWSSTGTELTLVGLLVQVQSNTSYAFEETSSATGEQTFVTSTFAASSTSAGAREYTPQVSRVIDFHRDAVDTTGGRVQIVHTFTPAGT